MIKNIWSRISSLSLHIRGGKTFALRLCPFELNGTHCTCSLENICTYNYFHFPSPRPPMSLPISSHEHRGIMQAHSSTHAMSGSNQINATRRRLHFKGILIAREWKAGEKGKGGGSGWRTENVKAFRKFYDAMGVKVGGKVSAFDWRQNVKCRRPDEQWMQNCSAFSAIDNGIDATETLLFYFYGRFF